VNGMHGRRGLSLFSISGENKQPQLIYCAYSTAVIAIIMICAPHYSTIQELQGLQFPVSTMVTPCSPLKQQV